MVGYLMSRDKDITFDHLGNYGNVFFQYAYMRKVADDYGYIPVLPEWNISHWHMCDPGFFDKFIALKRRYNISSGVFLNEYLNTENNHHTYLSDSENIGNDNIRLQGYFQDWELYKDVDQIKSYFNIPELDNNKDDLLLSLRIAGDFQGDGESTCMIIDPDILVNLVSSVIGNYNKLVIISDVYNDKIFDMFKGFAPKVVCRDGKSPNEDFKTILSYQNVIMPASTFTWWACYLGNCKTVYIPDSFGTMGIPEKNKDIFDSTTLPNTKLKNIPGKEVILYNAPFKNINI